MAFRLFLGRVLAGGHGLQYRHRQGRAAPAHRRYEQQDSAVSSILHGCKADELAQKENDNTDDGEAAHMGILQNLPTALQAPVGPEGIGHIHEPVQMEKACGKVGVHAQNQRGHQLREHPADAGQPPPDQAQLQTHHGQKQEHFIPGLLVPDLRGRDGAEHALAHEKGMEVGFHRQLAPL